MVRKGKTPNFVQWINHCNNYYDGRFSQDPTFMMVATNQYMRRKALCLGNLVARDQDLQNLSVKDVKVTDF